MVNAIWRSCANYYNDIPSDIFPTVGKSALYSFTLNVILQNGWQYKIYSNPTRSLTVDIAESLRYAKVAAYTSLIYSLITPLFKKIFGDDQIRLHRELMKDLISIISTYILGNYLGTSKINLVPVLFTKVVSSNLFKSGIELIPLCWEKMGMPLADIQNARNEMNKWGLLPTPGSGSIFITY